MNTSKIKTYAIQARRDFIRAVTERANVYGIFSDDHIEPLEFKGDTAIIGERAFPKKEGELREELVGWIKRDGFEMVMRSSAYTWFNRFVALRYMEIHDYLEHGYRVLSNNGATAIPEILEHAADIEFEGLDKDKVIELKLSGTKDNELYRLLIIAQCNDLHKSMPFLFDRIDSETKLLLPDNLLHSDSPIRMMVTEIDESDWDDVEIIGWIYQFYISERKDEVIGKVVRSEDIPAATQLFTPNWIVKYMVQNTLGRMWLATYPDSPLRDKMAYYIEPAEQDPGVQRELDAITPKQLNPEEITFLDPACGSGHILVEAYDILKEIYLERGYRTRDIPKLIIEKNLHGLDICDRAAQLACSAVLMKAREDNQRILEQDNLKLNIMAIQEGKPSDTRSVQLFFKGDEYQNTRRDLNEIVSLFARGKTFGSLITVPDRLFRAIESVVKDVGDRIGKWRSGSDIQNLIAIVRQTQVLARNYDCIVTNPPYMGKKGMNLDMKAFAKGSFPNSKTDLFSMFIERNLSLSTVQGTIAMITMQSWMFLSSFEKLRETILDRKRMLAMAHLGTRAFDTIGGEVVATTAFVLQNAHPAGYRSSYIRLVNGDTESGKKSMLLKAVRCPDCGWLFTAASTDFKKIPGRPIAYWMSKQEISIFSKEEKIGDVNTVKSSVGLFTCNNDEFVRLWYEVSIDGLLTGTERKWWLYNKGGRFRRWYGNVEHIVNYRDSGEEIREYRKKSGQSYSLPGEELYFRKGLTWTDLTSGKLSVRYLPEEHVYDVSGHSAFCSTDAELKNLMGYLNTKFVDRISKIINTTFHFQVGDLKKLPYPSDFHVSENQIVDRLIALSKTDWDSYETSVDFTLIPLLQPEYHRPSLKTAFADLRAQWRENAYETQCLEKENNRLFIEAYGLRGELTPDVPLSEITLTCNPNHRYGGNRTEEERETLLQADTIKELISYSIGCMMGRYGLDEPGLIYASSDNIDFDPSTYRSLPADDDGIIPIMDQDWFTDDAANRFVEFLRAAWSAETLDENLKFVADSLKPKNNETPIETIRRYLSTAFFKDHLRTYKKRPIYWLFSSGKEKAFECLVYLHRYNESTLSRMRSSYVTPLQGNLSSRLDFLQDEKHAAATTSSGNKLQKEIDKLKKKQAELSSFDDELRHYADMKVSLDLDDGAKVNYGKFGNLLAEKKAVTGKK